MSQKILLGAAAALLAACAALLGCDTRDAQPAPYEAVELRTYTVSPDQQDDVQSMLRYAVGGDPPVGRVASAAATLWAAGVYGPGTSLLVGHDEPALLPPHVSFRAADPCRAAYGAF